MGFPAFPSTTDTGAPRQPATTPREANSVGFGEAMAANEVNPLLRENTVDAIGRFSQMTSWENSDHPVVLFYQSAYGTEVTGLDILSLNKEFADQYFHGNLKQALQHNGIDFNFDWAGLKNDQAIEMIRRVEGYIGATEENIDPGYVVTVDNLLKVTKAWLCVIWGWGCMCPAGVRKFLCPNPVCLTRRQYLTRIPPPAAPCPAPPRLRTGRR